MKAIKITKELTIRDSRAVDVYFQEINKIPVLTPDEETELCQRIQTGEDDLRQELVLHNLKFVISVAKKYQSLGYRLGDLIAIGNIGLLKAAEKFDPSKGFKFISYAVWWIRQQIMSEIGFKVNGVRLPSNRVTVMYRIARFREEFYRKHHREPFNAEIAAEFDMDEDLVADMLAASSDMSSLNELAYGDEDDKEIVDTLSDGEDFGEDLAENDRTTKMAKEALSVLGPKQRVVTEYYFGLGGKTLDAKQIAEVTGLSVKEVKTLIDESLRLMKEKFGQK